MLCVDHHNATIRDELRFMILLNSLTAAVAIIEINVQINLFKIIKVHFSPFLFLFSAGEFGLRNNRRGKTTRDPRQVRSNNLLN